MKYDLKKKADRDAVLRAIHESRYTALDTIHRLDFDGKIYEWATNGFCLLAVEVKKTSRRPADEKPLRAIAEWLSLKPDAEIDSAAFLTWIGVEKYAKCPYCKGCGERPLLEGGWPEEEQSESPENGRVGNAVISRKLIAEILTYIPCPPRLQLTFPIKPSRANKNGSPMVLRGDGWIFVQQPTLHKASTVSDRLTIKGKR